MKALEKLSLDAYVAVGGTGYGRLDIRMDAASGKLYMLEVNAQCGLSDDEDYTSIGAILRYADRSFTLLIREIIQDAFTRRGLII
jgi:D-alanine-D-alanine ligase